MAFLDVLSVGNITVVDRDAESFAVRVAPILPQLRVDRVRGWMRY